MYNSKGIVKTSEPLVSIIVPVYNAEKFIEETIKSVISQTYHNWEMIIVDDASTDSSVDIVEKYSRKDPRIRLIKCEKNFGGPARPRNIGIKNAKGEYIAFLDSDDLWLPRKMEMQVNQLTLNNDIALSYVLYSFVFENGSIRGVLPKIKNRFRGNIFKSLYLKAIIPNSSVMVRRAVFEEIGLFDEDPRLIAAEDYDMWLRIAQTKFIDYVEGEPLLLYRVRNDSISRKGLINKCRRIMFIARKYAPYAGKSLFVKKILFSSSHLFIRLLLGCRRI